MNAAPNQTRFSPILIFVCIYIFLIIERPWESIRYLHGIPVERFFAIILIILGIFQQKIQIVKSPTNKWVYGLLAIHFILAPFAFNPDVAVDQGIEYSKMVFVYLLMLSVADDEDCLKLIVNAFVLSLLLYMGHSIIEYFNGRVEWRMGISRMIGVDETNSNPNSFGASVVLGIPFAYVLFKSASRGFLKKLYIIYFILSVICVVMTGSRSAFVALMFLLMMWVLMQKGSRRIYLLVAAFVAVSILWVCIPDEKKERIRTLWDENAGPSNAHESAKGRLIGWQVSWEMFKREPLTGVGAGGGNFIGYRIHNDIDDIVHPGIIAEVATQSHVLYGQVLAELGIFGAIFFIGLVSSVSYYSFLSIRTQKNQKSLSVFIKKMPIAILCCLALLLLLGLAGHNFYRPLWLWLAAWTGSLLRIENK